MYLRVKCRYSLNSRFLYCPFNMFHNDTYITIIFKYNCVILTHDYIKYQYNHLFIQLNLTINHI